MTLPERGPRSANRIRGVLLDVDGTLLDSNDAHTAAWRDALGEAGLPMPYERVRPLIGMGGDKLLPALGIEPHSKTGKIVSRRVGEIFKERYAPFLEPFAGTRDLLMHMKRLKLSLSVASSAPAAEMRALLHLAKVDDLIDARTDSSDAKSSKPDPDILQNAVTKIGLPPEELAMIGDTPYDVEAAHRAGLSVIVLRCGGWWSDSDYGENVEVFDDPEDLLERFDASSLGQRLGR